MNNDLSPPAIAENQSSLGNSVSSNSVISNVSVLEPLANSDVPLSVIANDASDNFILASIHADSDFRRSNSTVPAVGETGISTTASASGNSNPAPQISGGSAISNFSFGNPFPGQSPPPINFGDQVSASSAPTVVIAPSAPPNRSLIPEIPNVAGATASNVLNTSLSSDGQPAVGSGVVAPMCFARLTATQLVDKLSEKIPNLDRASWIASDFNGLDILEVSTLATLPSKLTEYLGLMPLVRDRVVLAIQHLIFSDTSLLPNIRRNWLASPPVRAAQTAPQSSGTAASPIFIGSASPTSHISISSDSSTPSGAQREGGVQASFNSPISTFALGGGGDVRTPAGGKPPLHPNTIKPAFLSHLSSKTIMNMSHSASNLFNDPTILTNPGVNESQSTVLPLGLNSSLNAGAIPNLQITVLSPSTSASVWPILDSLRKEEIEIWKAKARKEQITCDRVNFRSLASLMSAHCRDEIVRLLGENPELMGGVHVENWSKVSDEMILRALAMLFGPRSANEARECLKFRKFYFDDSTTFQDRFLSKFKEFAIRFRQQLVDFQYIAHVWPSGEIDWFQARIVEIFLDCFPVEPQIVGRDGRSMVAKCSNVLIVRTIIKENRTLKLDAIIDIIVKRFQTLDERVRSDSSISYTISPWKTQGKFNPAKRKFNEFSADLDAASQAGTNTDDQSVASQPVQQAKTNNIGLKRERPKDDSTHSERCANCGSKAHECGEETCYFFGHPKALGPRGVWPQGTPSLHLDDDEFKDWKAKRHEKFYSYPAQKAKAALKAKRTAPPKNPQPPRGQHGGGRK